MKLDIFFTGVLICSFMGMIYGFYKYKSSSKNETRVSDDDEKIKELRRILSNTLECNPNEEVFIDKNHCLGILADELDNLDCDMSEIGSYLNFEDPETSSLLEYSSFGSLSNDSTGFCRTPENSISERIRNN